MGSPRGRDGPFLYTDLEDYHLSLAFAGQERGFYIDIGAGHPIADNVSFAIYERGWRGLAVEPQPQLADLYAAYQTARCMPGVPRRPERRRGRFLLLSAASTGSPR